MKILILLLTLILSLAGCMPNPVGGSGSEGNFDSDFQPYNVVPRSFIITSLSAGDASATVTWSNSQNADSYDVRYRSASTLTFTTISNVTTPYTISGLTNHQNYLVLITAVNSRGSTNSQSLTVTPTDNIVTVPTAPVISYVTSAGTTISYGSTMSVVPSLLNNNGTAITNCASTPALPAWATLNPNTCVISGTPTAPMSATYTIRATNAAGTSAGTLVTLTVGAAVPSLSYLGATGSPGMIDELMTITPTLLNANGASITSCTSFPALPVWATINSSNCVISGIPDSTLATTSYLITATNSVGNSIGATVSLAVGASVPDLSYAAALGTMTFVDSAMSVVPTLLKTNGSAITNCVSSPALPAWATLNPLTCSITGTPDSPLPATTYAITASNGEGDSIAANVTLTAVAFNCPAGYVEVSANAGLGVGRFCVMQFEAKNNAGMATSQATGFPWTNISRSAAAAACNAIGTDYDLISNQEWMAIARDAEAQTANWSTGTVNSGLMPRGHSDNSPANALSISNTGDDYSDTLNTSGTAWEQKRNVTLSNGSVIWDLSGNASEWVDWRSVAGLQNAPTNCSASSQEFSAVACAGLSANDYLPNNSSLNSTNGLGKFFGGSSGTIVRGGHWNDQDISGLYSVNLTQAAAGNANIGFRCVNRPKAQDVPTISFAGVTGNTVIVGEPLSILPSTLDANGAAITNCSITPALPAWATINPPTCEISGTPTGVLPATTYAVTATNSVGISNTANITLTVNGAVPLLSYVGALGTSGAFGIPMNVSPTLLNGNSLPITDCTISPALPAWATLNSTTCSISGTPNGFLMATIYSVTAENSAGPSLAADVTLSVAATAPVISYIGATGVIGNVGVAMNITPTTLADNGASITNCTASPALPVWASLDPNTCIISGTPTGILSATTYTITASNSVGSTSGNVTFRANPSVPGVSYAGAVGTTINYGSILSVAPTALSANGAAITGCTISPALPAWATINPNTCVISGTPTAALAATTYSVRAINSAGNSLPASVTLTVNALVPSISYVGATGTTRPMNSAMSVAPTTLAGNGASITNCTTSPALPAWATINPTTCVISGTPNALLGGTLFTITAENSAGTTDANVTLTVIAAVPTLSYVGATGTIGAIGTPMSVTPTTLNNNGAAITNCVSTPGLPAWATLDPNTCVITGTPTATLAPTAYSIVATNSTGTSTAATVTLRANVAIPTLSYAGAPGTTIGFGDILSVAPTTLSNNGAAVTNCTSTPALPAWASINPTTCRITGTANAVLAATTYSIRATNSAGPSVAATVTLQVNAIPPTLSYIGALGTSGAFGVPMTVNPTTLTTNGAAVTNCVSSPALPTWATLNPTTCRITGTPDNVLIASIFNITATNSAGDSTAASVTLTVAASAPSLSFAGATGTTGVYGTLMSVTPTTLLENGATITNCTVTPALPIWASLNTSTCEISGTPNAILTPTVYSLRAGNSAGNSAPANVTLQVNATLPVLSYAASTGTTINFGAALSVTPSTLNPNGAPIINCSVTPTLPAWASLNTSTCVISGTANAVLASTTYSVTAVNSVGSSVAASVTLQVDAIAPTLSYSGATGTTGYITMPMSVTPTTLSANGSPITNCMVSPALPAWATLNMTTCVISGTPDATMTATTYTVTAENAIGPSTGSNVTLAVETVAIPELSFSGAVGTSGNVGYMMTVAPTNLDDNGSPLLNCTIAPALPAWATINATTCIISGIPNAILGATTYTITATNALGSATDTVTLTVTPGVPVLSYSGSTGTTINLNAAMTVTPTTLTDNAASITNCTATPGLPVWATLNPNTCVISGTANTVLPATTYSIVATNSAGNSVGANVTLTVNALAPTISYAGATGTIGSVGNAMSVTPTTLNDNGAAISSCTTAPALPAWASINSSTCVISGTPNALLGATNYTVTATNTTGSSTAVVNLRVIASVPIISYAGAAGTTVAIPTAMSVAPTTLTNNGAAITNCTIAPALPAGLSIAPTTCLISGTPNAVLASTTYTVTAINSAGSSIGASVTLQIDASVPTISYASSTGTTINIHAAMSVAPTTLNTNGAAITGCSATPALPAWATINPTTCVISGTANAVLAATTYAITATNSVGSSTAASVTLTVNSLAPTISYASSTGKTIALNETMSVVPTLDDNGDAIANCTIAPALPAWATINTSTCVISGTANALLAATTYTVTATNAKGNGTATVTLTVNANIPTLAYPAVPALKVGETLTLTPTTLANNGAAVTNCTSTPALPAGFTVAPTTCVISGIPTATSNATYSLVAINSAGSSVGTDVTIIVTPNVPVISYANFNGKIGTPATISPSSLLPRGENITNCTVSPSLPTWATLDPTTCVITGTPDVVLNPSIFIVTAHNLIGPSDTAELTLGILADTPILSYVGALGTNGAVGVPMTVSPTTLDTRGAGLIGCTSTPSLPAGLSLAPGTCQITGTPTVAVTNIYSIVAQNGIGSSVAASVTLTIAASAPILSYAGAPNTNGTFGQPFQVNPTSLNENGAAIDSCIVTSGNLPAWATINNTTCVISGTPDDSLAATPLTITIANSAGSTTANVTISVAPIAPTISYAGPVTINYGQSFNITPTIEENGDAIIGCNVTPTLPTGVLLDSTTCVISGTPTTGLTVTTYSIVASNDAGDSAAATIQLTVNPLIPTLNFDAATNSGKIGTVMAISPTSLVENGAAITACTSTPALPDGLTLNQSTCDITGTPEDEIINQAYDIRATNSAGNSLPSTVTIDITPDKPQISYLNSKGLPGYIDSPMKGMPSLLRDNGSPTTCTINPALPGGFTFDANTCTISGESSVEIASTTHTVRATNAYGFVDTNLSFSVQKCPTNYAEVPANGTLGTPRFCVMKFEARNDGGVASARPELYPWTELTIADAKAACRDLGYDKHFDLISNEEWMAIARDVETTASNWYTGAIGIVDNMLNVGNTKVSEPPDPIPPAFDFQILNITNLGEPYADMADATKDMDRGWEQKRTHALSNGESIWDFSSNVWEWTDWDRASGLQKAPMCTFEGDLKDLDPVNDCTGAGLVANDYMPATVGAFSDHGVGIFAGNPTSVDTEANVLRGGDTAMGFVYENGDRVAGEIEETPAAGIYTIGLDADDDMEERIIGFRCVFRPQNFD